MKYKKLNKYYPKNKQYVIFNIAADKYLDSCDQLVGESDAYIYDKFGDAIENAQDYADSNKMNRNDIVVYELDYTEKNDSELNMWDIHAI